MNLSRESDQSIATRMFVRVLRLAALVLSGSAGMIIFVVIPYAMMDRWHMLPDWGVLRFIYLLFPIILAWQHAGFYIVLMVIFCELIIILLQRPLQEKKLEAAVAVALCTLAYRCIHIGNRMSIR